MGDHLNLQIPSYKVGSGGYHKNDIKKVLLKFTEGDNLYLRVLQRRWYFN